MLGVKTDKTTLKSKIMGRWWSMVLTPFLLISPYVELNPYPTLLQNEPMSWFFLMLVFQGFELAHYLLSWIELMSWQAVRLAHWVAHWLILAQTPMSQFKSLILNNFTILAHWLIKGYGLWKGGLLITENPHFSNPKPCLSMVSCYY